MSINWNSCADEKKNPRQSPRGRRGKCKQALILFTLMYQFPAWVFCSVCSRWPGSTEERKALSLPMTHLGSWGAPEKQSFSVLFFFKIKIPDLLVWHYHISHRSLPVIFKLGHFFPIGFPWVKSKEEKSQQTSSLHTILELVGWILCCEVATCSQTYHI